MTKDSRDHKQRPVVESFRNSKSCQNFFEKLHLTVYICTYIYFSGISIQKPDKHQLPTRHSTSIARCQPKH